MPDIMWFCLNHTQGMVLTKATQYWKGDIDQVGPFAGGSQSNDDYVHAMIFEDKVK